MAEMTADAEEYSAEKRDELQEYINELQKEIDYYWGKFLERKRQKESYVFEKEIENIMAWKSQLDTILDPQNPWVNIISKHRGNVPTRVIFPLASRCTGATPPNTPTCTILQNGKMIVP